ncbi:MAG TPA: type 4a pilus biogenesis protein PilO [Desulfomonilia bacterium]|jgi:type IV pilus assembly protein PilO
MNINKIIDILLHQKPAVKMLSLLAFIIVIVGLYWYFLYRPISDEIKVLQPEQARLKSELMKVQAIVAEKPKYDAMLEQTKMDLLIALRQLPDKSEIPSLLENISSLGKSSGLEFLLFKPRVESQKNFYAEIPVDIRVEGTFKDIVDFFDKVSKMPRIVNISDITIGTPKRGYGGSTIVDTSCVATTYKFIEGVSTQ